jgi:hypothetical protein
MKVVATSTTAVTGSPQSLPQILGDDSKKDYIRDFLPEELRKVQAQGGYQQDFVKYLERFNISRQVTWLVDRTFASVALCDSFVRDHGDTVPTNCKIQVTVSGSPKTYTGSFIDHVKCASHAGVSCVFQYHAFLGPIN